MSEFLNRYKCSTL